MKIDDVKQQLSGTLQRLREQVAQRQGRLQPNCSRCGSTRRECLALGCRLGRIQR